MKSRNTTRVADLVNLLKFKKDYAGADRSDWMKLLPPAIAKLPLTGEEPVQCASIGLTQRVPDWIVWIRVSCIENFLMMARNCDTRISRLIYRLVKCRGTNRTNRFFAETVQKGQFLRLQRPMASSLFSVFSAFTRVFKGFIVRAWTMMKRR